MDEFAEALLADPTVRAEFDALAPEYAIYDQLLRARKRAKLTQAEVAERMKTTPSVVARLESADYRHTPSLRSLRSYAAATGSRLEIRLVPDEAPANPPASA
jgi:transcriptional regulator with XRE-family HTH domain